MLTVRGSRRQRGLSIIELLTGVALGLFVVAAAVVLVSGQLSSNRRLLLDTQMQQDLRATAEFVARELRRAGTMSDSEAIDRIWIPSFTSPPKLNFHARNLSPSSGTTTSVTYEYNRSGTTQFGFQLDNGRIRTKLEDVWQDLTDITVMRVTGFSLNVVNAATITLPCPTECSGGGTACWPTVVVRDIEIDIRAEAANDPAITRSIRTVTKLRNDYVRRGPGVTTGFCPA